MRRVRRIERREILNGWIKWALLPIVPFSVLFFDAWLNIQVRYKDYELGRLSVERRALDAELDMTRAQEARLNGVEHLTLMAELLELSPPATQQFQTVAYQDKPRRMPAMPLTAAEIAAPPSPMVELAPPQTVAIAKNMTPSPSREASETEVYLTPVAPPMLLDDIPRETSPLDDSELSLLSVEDMLGKL